jgi:hypothetical protein
MHEIMGEKLIVLYVAHAGVDQNVAIPIFYQHAAHGPRAHIVVVGRIKWLPQRFRHHAKHSAAVEFEVT